MVTLLHCYIAALQLLHALRQARLRAYSAYLSIAGKLLLHGPIRILTESYTSYRFIPVKGMKTVTTHLAGV